MSNKKYVLTNETINYDGRILHRIKAIKDFNDVKKGDLGGWIEKEKNLSYYNNSWVYDDAKVFDNAKVYMNAKIYNNAIIYGNAYIFGNAYISGNVKIFDTATICENAKVHENARIYSNAKVCGNVNICGNACINKNILDKKDYIVINNLGIHRTITFINTNEGIYVNYTGFSSSIDNFKNLIKTMYSTKSKDLLTIILRSMNLSISKIPDCYDKYMDTIKYVEKMFSKHKEDSLEYKVQEAINAIGELLNYNLSSNNKLDKYLVDSLETSQAKLINKHDALTVTDRNIKWEPLDYVTFANINDKEYFSLDSDIFIKINDIEAVCIRTGQTITPNKFIYVNRVKSFSVE